MRAHHQLVRENNWLRAELAIVRRQKNQMRLFLKWWEKEFRPQPKLELLRKPRTKLRLLEKAA